MNLIFKNFTRLNRAEAEQVLALRNTERVRRQMVNRQIIKLEDHMAWLERLTARDDQIYFMVCDDGQPIGVLDFTAIDRQAKEAEWGFYLKSGNRPGFGVVGFLGLRLFFDDWGFAALNSRTLNDNAASKQWHRAMFFQKTHEDGSIEFFRLDRETWLKYKQTIYGFFTKNEPESVEWLN